jgi:hypothetical protein
LEEEISEASDEALFKMLPMPGVASDPSLASAKYFLIKSKGMQPTEMVVVYFDSELWPRPSSNWPGPSSKNRIDDCHVLLALRSVRLIYTPSPDV